MAERKRKPRTRAQKDAAAKKARERRARRSKGDAKGKHPGGRPSKIDQEIVYTNPKTQAEERVTTSELILRSMRIGVPQKYAAQAAGVDQATVSRWNQRGAEALVFAGGDLEKVPEAERSYASFVNGVMAAKGVAVSFYVSRIHEEARRGGSAGVRAAVEWLRAQAGDEFKKKVSVDFEGERKPPPLRREDQETYRRAFANAYGDELPELDPGELAPPDVDEEVAEEREVEAP